MNIKFFNPALEFKQHQEEYVNNFIDVRSRGDLILRGDLEKFEKDFAKYVGTKYAVGVNSGTDALLIALKALDVKPEDRILVPSHTFVATAQVVAQIGAIPVLYDMDTNFEEIHDDIKCVMVAHIAGEIMPNFEALLELARVLKIPIVEDACQALGAKMNGKLAGSFGKVGCFSFYPAKILGSPGDGGALVTDDEEVYKFALEYRNHWKCDYSNWGINSRLDNVWASELNLKLARLDKVLARRKEIAYKYHTKLKCGLPLWDDNRVWQDFVIESGKRDELYEFLKEAGIETMKNGYPMPIGKLPVAQKYEENTLRIPINEVLTDEEQDYIIKKINEFYK